MKKAYNILKKYGDNKLYYVDGLKIFVTYFHLNCYNSVG